MEIVGFARRSVLGSHGSALRTRLMMGNRAQHHVIRIDDCLTRRGTSNCCCKWLFAEGVPGGVADVGGSTGKSGLHSMPVLSKVEARDADNDVLCGDDDDLKVGGGVRRFTWRLLTKNSCRSRVT